MTSFYSYNVLKVDDKAAFLSHIRRLQPAALLFYADELDFARQMKTEFPDMVIIVRNWPDDNLYAKQSPKSWLDAHESQAAGGLYLYTSNESGLSKENVQWHLDLMELAIQRGIHLVLLNPATGTWDIADFPVLKPLLIKASQHKDLFIIGVHEYAGGVITSGIAGGYPDNAGVAPGQPGGKNLIPVENWPKRDDIMHMTTFHLGRHSWIINYCTANNIPLPRFALTETGFDYLGDIGQWLNGLDHGGYSSVNGWKTLRVQWLKWWNKQSTDSWYVTQIEYAAENLLQGLEFALLYCYGDDGHWFNYDVSKSDIPTLLETMTPAPAQPPFDYGDMTKATLNIAGVQTVNLRPTPGTENLPIAKLADGAQIEISSNALKSGDYSWYKVVYQGMTGYIADTQNWRISAVSSEPPPATDKATVIIRIPGLTLEQAQLLIHNVEISIE